MIEQPDPAVRRRLSQSWRRGLILVGLGSVAGVALPYAVPAPSDALTILSLGCGLLGVVCLWLLADAFRPWIATPERQEEREHAEGAVLRGYRFLVALSATTAAYLVLWDPPLEALDGAQIRALLWGWIGLVLLLPPMLSAWGDQPVGEEREEVGPAVLLRARLRGESGRLHRAALVTLLGALPLLVIGPRAPAGVSKLWWVGALALSLTGLAGGLWVLARTLFHSGREDGNA